jgi:DNA-binding MarR family transcriptional regulator
LGKSLHEITTYQAGAMQASVHRSLQQLCDQILEPFGISKMQWLIIGHILDAGTAGIRISDLAKILSTTIPFITNAVNVLEARDIVMRKNNQQDNRSKLLVVSADFIPHCAEIETALRKGLRGTLYATIDPEDFRIYIKVLFQIHEAQQMRGRQ